MIEDPATEITVGDSFDITAYLQKTYPGSGAGGISPPQTLDYESKKDTILTPLSHIPQTRFLEYAKFNVHVDAIFNTFVQLSIACLPLHPATAEISNAEMARRADAPSWDYFQLNGETREKTKASFLDALVELGKLFVKDTSGPFIPAKSSPNEPSNIRYDKRKARPEHDDLFSNPSVSLESLGIGKIMKLFLMVVTIFGSIET
ncbi:hypothetical protein RU639_005361 [Aspergillus parasiticus]